MSSDWYPEDNDADDIAAGLETVLSPKALRSPSSFVEQHIQSLMSRLSPADADNFMSGLKQVGSEIGKFATSKEARGIAGAALPIAGTAVGTMFGGPAGAAIGKNLGGAAGQAIAGGGGGWRGAASRAMPGVVAAAQGAGFAVPQPLVGVAQSALAGPNAAAGSTAAAQLLSLVQNPALMSSLVALAMGQHGATEVSLPATGTDVPVGAMMNLVGQLANQAAEDADDILAMRDAETPEYLLDASGCVSCDPNNAAQRAAALWRVLAAEDEAADAMDAEVADEAPDDEWADFDL